MTEKPIHTLRRGLTFRMLTLAFGTGLALSPLLAQAHIFGEGRILGTGGVTTVSGAAGGGIVPWALIGGYGDNEQIGYTAFYTNLATSNYLLNAYGASVGIDNRIEVSLAQQSLGLGNTANFLDTELGEPAGSNTPLANGADLTQDIVGLKVRLFGNAIYQQNSWLPQVAFGIQYHHNSNMNLGGNASLLGVLGAKSSGTSYYLAATKVWLDGLLGRTTILDVDVDATRANQNGLLGFEGYNDSRYHYEPEVSAGVFLNRHVVLGGEYRAMPQNQLVGNNATGDALSATNAWKDIYVAYIPNKSFSVTFAYAMLGHIATINNQSGLYTSITATF